MRRKYPRRNRCRADNELRQARRVRRQSKSYRATRLRLSATSKLYSDNRANTQYQAVRDASDRPRRRFRRDPSQMLRSGFADKHRE